MKPPASSVCPVDTSKMGNRSSPARYGRRPRKRCVELSETNLEFVHVVHRRHGHDDPRLGFFFLATAWQGQPVNREPHKCAGLVWTDPAQPPATTIAYTVAALEQIHSGRPFSLDGWAEHSPSATGCGIVDVAWEPPVRRGQREPRHQHDDGGRHGYTVGQPDPCRPLLGCRSTAHPTGCRPRRNVSSWLQLSPRTPGPYAISLMSRER
uniref:Putative hydrolase n=1 Tax=Micromonospora maris (strain DSM 45365 / JCM 31040 / NBRC 109089 / NRRL B-24793 / AB-18-032) TaxID=263358 RepID=G1C860_MICM1|nr:putative hydrolase [Micromonospora maris AB-18-032]